MRDNCNVLANALHKQGQMVASIISEVLGEKFRLIKDIESFEKRVNEILSDEDIRTLEALAAADETQALRRFGRLPNLLGINRQKLANVVLESVSASANSLLANSSTDFEVDTWLVAFNTGEDQLNTHISQLQAFQDTISIFQETRELLARQWCTDMQNNSEAVICGGSCLSPPEYISPASNYEFKAQACDVGFRIVIPAN